MEELDRIARLLRAIDVGEGETLIRQGEPGTECYVILEGEVEVERDGETLNTLGRGEIVGEVALIAPILRTATVKTTSPTQLLALDADEFKLLVRQNPTIAVHVLEALGERIPSWLSLPSFATPPSE